MRLSFSTFILSTMIPTTNDSSTVSVKTDDVLMMQKKKTTIQLMSLTLAQAKNEAVFDAVICAPLKFIKKEWRSITVTWNASVETLRKAILNVSDDSNLTIPFRGSLEDGVLFIKTQKDDPILNSLDSVGKMISVPIRIRFYDYNGKIGYACNATEPATCVQVSYEPATIIDAE